MSEWDDDLPVYWGVSHKPVAAPRPRDRALEIILYCAAVSMLAAAVALALYLAVNLAWPEVSWLSAPLFMGGGLSAWQGTRARRKRLRSEAEVIQYQEAVDRMIAAIDEP